MTGLRRPYWRRAALAVAALGAIAVAAFLIIKVENASDGIWASNTARIAAEEQNALRLGRLEDALSAISGNLATIQGEVAKLADGNTAVVDQVDQIGEEIRVLGQELGSPGTEGDDRVSDWFPVDGSDIYQKSGLLEFYGLGLTQRRTGPVAVADLVLSTVAPVSWVVWTPSQLQDAPSRVLMLELGGNTGFGGRVDVALTLGDGMRLVASLDLGEAQVGAGVPGIAGPEVTPPADVSAMFAEPLQKLAFRQISATRFVALLPLAVAGKVDGERNERITVAKLALRIDQPQPVAFSIARLGLASSQILQVGASQIHGSITNEGVRAGDSVELLLEDGSSLVSTLTPDGGFAFPEVASEGPVSLRFSRDGIDYFSTAGRWFMPMAGRHLSNIKILPEFDNPTQAPPDPTAIDVTAVPSTEPLPFRYTPNRRTVWPGLGPVQEFEGRSFANSAGFLDRDREELNQDRCIRILVVGGSTYVGLQVKPNDKFNVLLEADLGRRMGRCVEAISAGRDNGDVAANYRTITDYGMKFRPDLVVIEHMSAFSTQMEPELLRRTIGWNYAHSPIDNFYFNESGELTFRPSDPSWALDAQSPTAEPLIPGLNAWYSFHIPSDRFPAEATASFNLLEAILLRLRAEYPDTQFVIATGRDQAGCISQGICSGEFTMPDGTVVPMGVRTFLENLGQICARVGIPCINPPIPSIGTPQASGLTYVHDGHYSVKGHQWLAKVLSAELQPLLEKRFAQR